MKCNTCHQEARHDVVTTSPDPVARVELCCGCFNGVFSKTCQHIAKEIYFGIDTKSLAPTFSSKPVTDSTHRTPSRCAECTIDEDDPAQWCDCCRRAHGPESCPVVTINRSWPIDLDAHAQVDEHTGCITIQSATGKKSHRPWGKRDAEDDLRVTSAAVQVTLEVVADVMEKHTNPDHAAHIMGHIRRELYQQKEEG